MKATVLQRIKMKGTSMEAYEVEIAETGEHKKLKRANLAGGRVNNGAILSLNLLKNSIGVKQARALVIILKEHSTLKSLCGNNGDETELDMSGKMKDAEDAIMLAAEIIDNGAISSINLLRNSIPVEQAQELVKIMQAKEKLTTLCGLSKEETELGFSRQRLGAGDAVLIANDISDMGALLVLSLQNNELCAAGGKALAEGLKDNQVITELNIASNRLGYKTPYNSDGADMSGVIALADVIPDMGALTSLNMSKNHIKGAEAGKALGDALAGNTVLKELDISGGGKYSPNMDIGFVKAFTPGLSDNGGMTSLNLASNKLGVKGAIIIGEAIKVIDLRIYVDNEVCHCSRFGTILMSI
jgi:hypothetical protein